MLLVRIDLLQVADQENEQRKRLELAAQNANNKMEEDVAKRNKINQKKQQVSKLTHTSLRLGCKNNLNELFLHNTKSNWCNLCALDHLSFNKKQNKHC